MQKGQTPNKRRREKKKGEKQKESGAGKPPRRPESPDELA
jgi:hypothetical protein